MKKSLNQQWIIEMTHTQQNYGWTSCTTCCEGNGTHIYEMARSCTIKH